VAHASTDLLRSLVIGTIAFLFLLSVVSLITIFSLALLGSSEQGVKPISTNALPILVKMGPLASLAILIHSARPTSTNAPPILARMALLMLMASSPIHAFVFLVILIHSVRPTSTNALPILAKTALPVLTV
jgi:hypothetical protein